MSEFLIRDSNFQYHFLSGVYNALTEEMRRKEEEIDESRDTERRKIDR